MQYLEYNDIKLYNMKKILINENKLQKVINNSINKILKEHRFDGSFNDLNSMIDNPDDEEFNRCMNEVSEFTEQLSKSYRPEIIIKALQQEVKSFEKCQNMGEISEEDERWMSDNDIAGQYNDMKIINFILLPLKKSEGWEGSFEIEFPNADGVDYDNYMVNNFIVYDKMGDRIAWDNWMPDEQTKYLENIIRQEIMKKGSQI